MRVFKYATSRYCAYENKPRSPVEVILDVLCQVHVEHDEVVQVAPGEGHGGGPQRQATAPLADATHGVHGDLGRGLHVPQHGLQGDAGDLRSAAGEEGMRGAG